MCYECIIGKNKPENYLNKELKDILELIKDQQMKKYDPLVDMENEKYLLYLSASGEFTLHMVIYLPK